MKQLWRTEAGRRACARLAARRIYPVHFMHPSRVEDMPIIRIEEDRRGFLHVTTSGYPGGSHWIHMPPIRLDAVA